MKSINLKSLSVDDLLSLRDRINDMLESRVASEQRELEARLKRLERFRQTSAKAAQGKSSAAPDKKRTKAKRRKQSKKVAVKYRNASNPSETWTGRGLQPRWLRAAIAAGQKIEDFKVAA